VVELIGDLDDGSRQSPIFRADAGHLRVDGGPELLAAFAAAPKPLRQVILRLAVALAKVQDARSPAAARS
jgi:hypothetical protein